MLNAIKSFAFLLVIALMASCQQETTKTTPGGFEYTVHRSGGGEKAKSGDQVSFHVVIRNGDSVMMDTRAGYQVPQFVIPEAAEVSTDPVMDLLPMLSKNDSATVIMSLDTMAEKPFGFEDANEIFYDVVIVDLESKEAVEALGENGTKIADYFSKLAKRRDYIDTQTTSK